MFRRHLDKKGIFPSLGLIVSDWFKKKRDILRFEKNISDTFWKIISDVLENNLV
jgi:hypothetical protein